MGKRIAQCHESGFTFLELMITLAIAGVLLGLAVPSLQSWTADSAIVSTTNDFVSSVHAARSTAVSLGSKVGMCPTKKATDPAAVCETNVGWNKGWIVFVDDNENGQRDLPDEQLLVQKEQRNIGFTFTPEQVYQNLIYFSYSGTSITPTAAAVPVSGKITISYGGSENREVTISANGHVGTKKP